MNLCALQLTLFAPPPEIGASRRSDPSTSKEAARRLNPGSLQGQIVRTLRASDQGLTIEELTRRLGRKEVSVSPRLRELERKGLIYRSGRRANISGLEAIVWRALR